jgi:hypothetical protein
MDYEAAQRHWLDTQLSQQTLMSLSDNPGTVREPPMSALFRQAQREWERSQRGDGGMDYIHVKF